jgi:amino acid transporter
MGGFQNFAISFNLVGQIAVTAAIAYGCAFFMTSLLNLLWGYPNSFGWIYFLYGMILLGAGLINMFKVPITAFLNSVSAWWHMIGVVVIVFVLAIVPDHHRSISYVFGQTVNNSGFGGQSWMHGVYIYVFLTGLLMAQYTITGYVPVGAHGRGDAPGLDRRGLGHGHVGRGLRDLPASSCSSR